MARRGILTLIVLGLGIFAGLTWAEDRSKAGKVADVTGGWTGIWGPYSPAPGTSLAKDKCKRLDCQVALKDGTWHATFEGECGRPYKYTIKMTGRQAGGVVL